MQLLQHDANAKKILYQRRNMLNCVVKLVHTFTVPKSTIHGLHMGHTCMWDGAIITCLIVLHHEQK